MSGVDFTNTVGKCQGVGGAKREALSQVWEPVASRRPLCLSGGLISYLVAVQGLGVAGQGKVSVTGNAIRKDTGS